MTDIAIVDYGMGNLRSVAKALEHVAPTASIVITDDPEIVRKAGRVVVPGQGAMPDCLRELDKRGLRSAVRYAAMSKPFLGICIGLQMLCDSSEEGNVEGLGIVAGTVRRFPSTTVLGNSGQRFKVPHMGWNQVHQAIEHALWKDISRNARFYFVHSYYMETINPEWAAATTNYPFSFTSAVAKDNIFAVQFHPEKSHDDGLTLLNNFVRWEPLQYQGGIAKSTLDLFSLQTSELTSKL